MSHSVQVAVVILPRWHKATRIEGMGTRMARSERMTEKDFRSIEAKLCEALGSEHGIVADYAYRGLIRVLSECRELQQENAMLRGVASPNSVGTAQGA